MVDVSLGKVWGDAWAVYKLLFRRSVVTAAIVYTVVEAVSPLSDAIDRRWASILLGLIGFVLGLTGPVLVQGALVEIVREIHEGRSPKEITALYRRALGRLRSLLWASIVYGLGVFLGLLLLIVPGLLAAARWCLMAPLIMLEGEDAAGARARSRVLIMPHTWPVLGIVVATFVATTLISDGAAIYTSYGDVSSVWSWVIGVVASSVTAPFYAHVLTVIYYRVTDPERPVIHPDVRSWRSVWQGA